MSSAVPGHPKSSVAVLESGAAWETRAHGIIFSFKMSAQRAARRLVGGTGVALPVDNAVVITMPIDADIRVPGVRSSRLGRWAGFAEALAEKAPGRVSTVHPGTCGGWSGCDDATMAPRRALRRLSRFAIEWLVAAWELVGLCWSDGAREDGGR